MKVFALGFTSNFLPFSLLLIINPSLCRFTVIDNNSLYSAFSVQKIVQFLFHHSTLLLQEFYYFTIPVALYEDTVFPILDIVNYHIFNISSFYYFDKVKRQDLAFLIQVSMCVCELITHGLKFFSIVIQVLFVKSK